MRRLLAVAAVLGVSWLAPQAQDDNHLTFIHRIKVEAFDNPKVMDELANISDLCGPRPAAFPEWDHPAQWAMQAMKDMGLANVHEAACLLLLNLRMPLQPFQWLVQVHRPRFPTGRK